jgi:hypothetical protein
MSAISQPKSSQSQTWRHFPANTYSTLGMILTTTGALLAVVAYLVLHSTPVTALGASTLLMGTVALAIASWQPKIPPQAAAILLQSGEENISALVEELGLNSRAVYLPSSMTGDKPKALIPLDSNVEYGRSLLPKRLIVKYGSKADSAGLLVVTPGSAVGEIVSPNPYCSATDLEVTLSQVLAGALNLADNTRVTIACERVVVEVGNPRLETCQMWIYRVLGTPVASIVASVVAQLLDKPITITSESCRSQKCIIELKVSEATL